MMKYKLMIICSVIFNIFDGRMTYYFVKNGLAVETNPIMNVVIQYNMELFLLLKFSLSFLFIFVWIAREKLVAKIGIVLIFVVYLFVVFQHLRYFWS